MIHPTAKMSEEVNRKLYARNTVVRHLTLNTNRESHNAQRYRRMDRQTTNDAKSQSYCVQYDRLKTAIDTHFNSDMRD